MKLFSRTNVRWASLGVLAASVAAPVAVQAQDEELDSFTITGSRIPRLDLEGVSPVEVITSQDIEVSGFNTLGDYLQTLPANSGSMNAITEGASFTRGATTLNIRGLGGNRFLTLVNGRRMAPYALTNSDSALVFDFNSIPTAAIESIEFLKEGASAIYGSDAVTGVLNIKLRRDYEGLNIGATIGNTDGHDMLFRSVNAVVGTSTAKTSIMVAAAFQDSKDSFASDYSRSQTSNYSFLGDRGIDLRSGFNFPSNVVLSADQATAAGLTGGAGFYKTVNPDGVANPSVASFEAGINRFEFAPFIQLYPEYEYMSMLSTVRHEISDNLYAFAELSYASNVTDFVFTPAVVNSRGTMVPSTGTTLTLPANNPFNPFGFDVTDFRYRTSFLPAREFLIESVAPRFLAGLGGNFAGMDNTFADWTWEGAVSYSYNQVTDTAGNAIRADDLQNGLSGTTVDTAINPFGATPNQALLSSLLVKSISTSKAEVLNFDFTAGGSLYDFEFGTLGAAVGLEYRKEKLSDRPDSNSYVGSGGGDPFDGNRDVTAAYLELLQPVGTMLEFTAAVRYEDYSDFGDTTKPKVGVKVRPLDWLVLRASYSRSFKAPELGRLFAARQESFSQQFVDPEFPNDPASQVLYVTGGNPNLQPEDGRSIYAGAVIEVPSVQNLTFNVDFFDFKIEDVIVDLRSFSTNFVVTNPDLFPGAVVRDAGTNRITRIDALPQNQALERWQGFDFGMRYRLDTDELGSFRFRVDATRVRTIGRDGGVGNGFVDRAGLYGDPKWRGNVAVDWMRGDFEAGLFITYIGRYKWDSAPDAIENGSFIRMNPSFTYSGLWNSRITVGVNNVFDKNPPSDGYYIEGYDTLLYNGMSRFWFARVERDF